MQTPTRPALSAPHADPLGCYGERDLPASGRSSDAAAAFLFGSRLMAVDGTVEDVADTLANATYFGYHGGRH